MRTFVTIMFLAFCINQSFAQMPESLLVKEYQLSNGLTVWLNEDHTQPKVFGAIVVKAGSKDCPDTGIAHYFEHMMFKGTNRIGTVNYEAEKPILENIEKKYDELAATQEPAIREQIQQEINQLSIAAAEYAIPNEFSQLISKYGGSQLNAGTSYDFTVYFNEFSPQYITQWAEINSERLIDPVFRFFQSELETVYEEKNMYSDAMGALAMEKLLERYFYPHPYAYPIIGSTEYLKNPQLSRMKKFFEEYYVASNMGLILCGDFNSDEVLPLLEEKFSRVRAGEAPQKESLPPPAFQGKETIKVKFPIPFLKIMAIGFRGVPSNHPDQIALNIAVGILNNENGTGYLDKLSVDRKVMFAAGMNQSLNEAGILGVAVVPKLIFQSYSSAEKLVWKEIERVKNGDFSDEVFESFKLAQKRNIESSLEEIKTRANVMMTLYSQGISWEEYLKEIQKIDSLTKEDVMEVARKYFGPNYLYATKKTGNYPKNNLPKPDFQPIVPKHADTTSLYAKELERLPVKQVEPKFIDFNKDVYTSSLTPLVNLYVTPNPVNDIFTFQLYYEKGMLETPLLGQVAAYLPFLGTESMSFQEFREKLQTLGSTLTFEAKERCFIVSVSGFDKNFNKTLELLGDFLSHVKADKKQLKQLVNTEQVMDKAFFKASDNVAGAMVEKIRYGNNSRFLTKPSLSEVKKLKADLLIDLFKETIETECNLHYCGQLSVEEVTKEVKAKIPPEKITRKGLKIERELLSYTTPTVYFFDDPKVSQSIVYSYISGENHPDSVSRSTAKLFSSYFGGDMSSIMFQEIREFRSFAYRVKADYELPSPKSSQPGSFMTMLSTQTDKTTDALEVLDSLLKNMPVKADKIPHNKQVIINEVNNSYPSFRELSPRIAFWKREGFTEDPHRQSVNNIKHLEMEQVEEFYQRVVKDKPIVYIIVGNKNKTDMKKLASFGEIVFIKKKDIYK